MEYANRSRAPATKFRVGDMVILDARNIKIRRPNQLLDYKNIGPFKIVRGINNIVYKLKLLEVIGNVFPVFHPWLLHLDRYEPLDR